MKTVDEDIAKIKAELLIVKQNFTKIDVKMDDIDVEITTNQMNSDEADQCLREDFEKYEVKTDKVIWSYNQSFIKQVSTFFLKNIETKI